jgi:RNA polymerase sigma factor (TIGR02999 family)
MASLPSQEYATVLYDRLRALAHARMTGQRAGHTLDPTGLANEAIIRLLKCDPANINDEDHFMTLAAEAMRQILVDHARARAAQKRGGGERPASLEDRDTPGSDAFGHALQVRMDPARLLVVNEALENLEKQDSRAAAIVKLRTFAGMNPDEIAALLGLSRRTVERRWRYAMAALRVSLAESDIDSSSEDRHE